MHIQNDMLAKNYLPVVKIKIRRKPGEYAIHIHINTYVVLPLVFLVMISPNVSLIEF